jgi:hypothetical protein
MRRSSRLIGVVEAEQTEDGKRTRNHRLSLETGGLTAALGDAVHSHRRVVRHFGVRLENLANLASASNVALPKDI